MHEVLEICLNEIEKGADVDAVLFRYPELEAELRPILEASVKAKAMAAPAPPQDVLQRNRAKLLQRAAELRERKNVPALRRTWSVPLRRLLVSLAVVAMLFMSGTGLVRASSSTLPGDNLYPVKRGWENLLLAFTFDAERREALEFEHESERLEELFELIAQGRSAEVEFAGYVTRLSADEWRVSGVTVFISAGSELPEQQVVIGDAVRVHGRIQNGGVLADRIELLPPGSRLPEVKDEEPEIEEEEQEIEEESGVGPVVEATVAQAVTATPAVPTPTAVFDPVEMTIEGVVSSIQNSLIVINGIAMDIQFAEIKGTPAVGVAAKAEGYINAGGVFIVERVEFRNASPNAGSDNTNDGDDNAGGDVNDNGNDDDDNDNDNDNDNSNDNDND
jgi:hypothetical protein